ncbi:hypothetical protein E4T38_09664 [Aureobasidium subglaciale]|nr:hypothetical protein E4T38_09664 [Aureobasidium subglaciale]KAI5213613.1 hypothetical protein E4T40_09606 [Aureobasidium subglaciale]KAI5215284.1 hypothetical protein E4T41_09644 [Aureobasidium subglaciale]KAI5253266.1 hypothetical protein E4T46_09621 [Aureobasidium subglaciale]
MTLLGQVLLSSSRFTSCSASIVKLLPRDADTGNSSYSKGYGCQFASVLVRAKTMSCIHKGQAIWPSNAITSWAYQTPAICVRPIRLCCYEMTLNYHYDEICNTAMVINC